MSPALKVKYEELFTAVNLMELGISRQVTQEKKSNPEYSLLMEELRTRLDTICYRFDRDFLEAARGGCERLARVLTETAMDAVMILGEEYLLKCDRLEKGEF